MRTILSLAVLLLLTTASFSQTSAETEQDVYNAKELTFYGYDFSHLKLTETKRLNDDMTAQIFSWIGFCQENITDEKLTGWFRKQKVVSNINPTVAAAKKINGNDVVSFVKNTISKDSIQHYLNAFEFAEKSGIGFIVFLENFHKPSKTTTGYFTFFDIATKKILLNDYFSGKEVDGYGLTNYWGIGIIGTTKNYAAGFRKRAKQ